MIDSILDCGLKATTEILVEIDPSTRAKISATLFNAFVTKTRHRQILPEKLARFKVDIGRLAEKLTISLGPNKTVVILVDGLEGQTLNQLKFGTDWFDGRDDVVLDILSCLE